MRGKVYGYYKAGRMMKVGATIDDVVGSYPRQRSLTDSIPIIRTRNKTLILKRIFDVFLSGIGLILSSPSWVFIALAIIIEDGFPVIIRQERVGRYGKLFKNYKFRSMRKSTLKEKVKIQAVEDDSRITRIGKILRKCALDELPQLINILKGDMNFIGPKPVRPFFVESFKRQIPFYLNRLQIKPGMTGWAQVKWRYDETIEDVKEKLSFDLYYINNRNIWLDIKIILLTIQTVLLGKGQ